MRKCSQKSIPATATTTSKPPILPPTNHINLDMSIYSFWDLSGAWIWIKFGMHDLSGLLFDLDLDPWGHIDQGQKQKNVLAEMSHGSPLRWKFLPFGGHRGHEKQVTEKMSHQLPSR